MHRALARLVAIGFVAAACGSPAPSPSSTGPTAAPPPAPADFEIETAQFVNTGGCGDAFFWATNAAGSAAITIEWRGAASEAWASDGFEATEQLPNPEITVTVIEGSQLTNYYCNDIRMPGQGTTSEIEASSGTVEIAVRPTAEGFEPSGQADLRLSDVTFRLAVGGEVWHLAELVIENVSVGWLAG
jgi:hypothetical protein